MVGRSDEHDRGRDVYGVPEGSVGKLLGWDSSGNSMSSVPQYSSQGVPVVPQGVPVVPQSGVSQGVPMSAASYGGSVSVSQVPSGSENRPVLPQGVQQVAEAGQRKRPVVLIVLAVVLVVMLVVVGVFGVFGVLVWQKKKAEDAAYREAHQPYAVDIAVNAAGWDEDSSSPIPLRITGKDLDGKPVEREVLYSGGDTGIELLRGDYEVLVPASPVLEDGNIFQVPAKPIELSITADTPRHSSAKAVDSVSSGKAGADSGAGDSEAAEGSATSGKDELAGKDKSGDGEARDSAGGVGSLVELSLEPMPAEDVTDDQIAQIEKVFSEFGMDAAQVKEWTQAVSECRQARLDQIAAEEKAAAQAAEEAARKAAEEEAARQAAAAAQAEAEQQALSSGPPPASECTAANLLEVRVVGNQRYKCLGSMNPNPAPGAPMFEPFWGEEGVFW